MPTTQISIFVENKPGRLADVASKLEQSGIRIIAFCIAEAGDFGIIRLILDNPKKGFTVLKGHAESSIPVVAVLITEKVGIAKIANLLGANDLNIEYAYSTTTPIDGHEALILRVDDIKKTEEILGKNGVNVLNQKDIISKVNL